jgi:pyruvate dehydrogenase E2 component (dihydrolipoamide acetyltransferase)
MPRLTIDMEKGTVLEWRKEEGDPVEKGEIVAVVFGDKVEWELEAPAAGVLLKILAAPEAEVAVNRPIAWVGAPGEAIPAESTASPSAAPVPSGGAAGAASAEEAPEGEGGAPAGGKPRASPAAKRLARELRVDLARVRGTGPGGRIVEADVLAASKTAPAPAMLPVTLTPLRKAIGERMSRSWRTVPHFTVECEADLETARTFREAAREAGKPVPSYTDVIVACAGRALREFEGMRLRWDGETLVRLESTAVGVAVHTEEGLVVPVLEGAGEKTLDRISAEIREMAERARSGKLRPDDLHPACLTVSNLGMFGISRFTPVVNHPECAILAVGEMREMPVVREGNVVIRATAALDLAVDHRAIDGGLAAWFLGRLKEILEQGKWGE